MSRALWLTLFLLGCGPEQLEPQRPTPSIDEPKIDTTTSLLTGFPCDVREALQANCASCHAGGAYVAHFTTREDLLRPGGEGSNLGAELVARLRPGAQWPMPPTSATRQPTDAERLLLDSWVAAGLPAGACGPLVNPP